MINLQVIGRLGKDCTVNNVNGKNVINFSIAHSEKFKSNGGEDREKTIWVDCAKWGESTALAPYLKKGQQVYVEGSPESHVFVNNEGEAKGTLKLTVRKIELLGAASTNNGTNTSSNHTQASHATASQQPGDPSEPLDDLPF